MWRYPGIRYTGIPVLEALATPMKEWEKNTPPKINCWLRHWFEVTLTVCVCFAMLATAEQCEVPVNERCKCGDDDITKWMCLSIGCCWQERARTHIQHCYQAHEQT